MNALRFLPLLICVLLLSCAPATMPKISVGEQKQAAWQYYRNDLGATGKIASSEFTGKLDIVWEDRVSGKPCGPLSIWQGRVLLPNAKGKLLVYDADSGHIIAAIKTSGTPQTGALLTDSQLVFAVAPPRNILRVLRWEDNKLLWKKAVKDVTSGSILVQNNLMYSSGEGSLTAVDISNGKTKWRFDTEGRCTAAPAFQNGTLYQPADNNTIYAVNAETGSKMFETATQAPVVSNVVLADDLFCVDIDGTVYRIDPVSGAVKWSTPTHATVWAAPAVDSKHVYLAASSGSIIALDAASGTILWNCTVTDVCKAAPVVIGDVVVAGTMTGRLFSINAETGEVIDQRQLLGAISVAPVADEKHLFVATDKGYIHCFGKRNESTASNN